MQTPGFCLEFDFNAADFAAEWKRCNLVANYLADYGAYEYLQREKVENLFSTIINELLEAVARLAAVRSEIHFRLFPKPDTLSIEISHQCEPGLLGSYQDFVSRFGQGLPEEQYLEMLAGEGDQASPFNQLGLAMIVHDFGGSIATQAQGGPGFLQTRVQVPTEDASQ